MKHKIFWLSFVLFFTACKSNPNKAEKIETRLEQAEPVTGGEKVGLKKGEMVVLDKVAISEKLRDLQNTVFSLEDRVYGTRKLGSLGLYGELKSCKRKLASRQYGGAGTLVWTEPLDRVTDKEEDLKVGLDEKQNLVGVSEEYLKDRLSRFSGYKTILQQRFDEYQEKIESCKGELGKREMDSNQSSKVMVQEAPKSSVDRASINQYMCGFVKTGASLQSLLLNIFAKGWMSLSDMKMDQNLISVSLKDAKGKSKENGLLFDGWKLAFDQGPVTVGEVLNGKGKDAHLVAWTFDHKADVQDAAKCLPGDEGVWNP